MKDPLAMLKGIVSDDVLQELTKTLNEHVSAQVDAAIAQYDETTTERVQDLLNKEEKVKTHQLKRLMEGAQDRWERKYENLKNQYENKIRKDAEAFKKTLTEATATFIDDKLGKLVPNSRLVEVAKNTAAYDMLENLRTVLAVESLMADKTVRKPLVEARKRLNESEQREQALKQENQTLLESVNAANAKLLLEEKTKTLPEKQASYMKRVLADKPLEYITENFDYFAGLYRDEESARKTMLRESAMKKSQTTLPEKPKKKVQPPASPKTNPENLLMEELINNLKPRF